MDQNNYLTNIPDIVNEYGFCKVLAVRHETIHLKHILTECFVRKSIDLTYFLNKLDLSLFEYLEYFTNRMRRVYNFNRNYISNCNEIVKNDRSKFFPTQELYKGLKTCIILDFDGVITKKKFESLYKLCIERNNVYICSANPSVNETWFEKRNLPLPDKIYAMKGMLKKIRQIIEIQKRHDYVFYVDNEKKYLEYAWLFGVKTFHWNGKTIKNFSLSSK